jgi:hypothetical protein
MSVHRADDERRTAIHRVQLALALLRRAIFSEPPGGCGYTYDALEQHTGKAKSYLHAVLNGEKRCSLEFLASLPRDVRAKHAQLVAQQYSYTVAIAAKPEEAAQQLLAGLLGLLKPQPAKAELHEPVVKSEVA